MSLGGIIQPLGILEQRRYYKDEGLKPPLEVELARSPKPGEGKAVCLVLVHY